MVMSADFPPYDKMIQTSLKTWDSVQVDNIESVFFCGKSDKPDTDKIIYVPVEEGLYNMGHKTIAAFEWALQNKDFEYLARPHSCIYVDKKSLSEYTETLPIENACAGLEVKDKHPWLWGGCGTIYSKDVVKKIVENKHLIDHSKIEDMSISQLVGSLGIPFLPLKAASIDTLETNWRCMCYGGVDSFEFENFSEISKARGQVFYRVKCDGKRYLDEEIMNNLFKYLHYDTYKRQLPDSD